MPSSIPMANCVAAPYPFVNMGAQITVENLELIADCRLAITNVRYCFVSPGGWCTR